MRQAIALLLLGSAVTAAVTVSARQFQDPNHETRTPDVPGLTAATSRCATSDDPTLGTADNPIKVGGGALYLASREVKYLSALRGPSGEGVHFKRTGSTRSSGSSGPLDIYTLEYAGLAKPISLYVDGYHWATPLAPKGWLCGADMNLNPPGPDPFETQKQMMALAIRLGATLDPISLDPDGSKAHGVFFDHARLIGAAARKAEAAGKPLNPEALPRDVAQPHMIVIAFPRTCGGKSIAPQSVIVTDANGRQPTSMGKTTGDKVNELVPAFNAPAGSIAIEYATGGLIQGARAVVRYDEPCGAEPAEVVLTSRYESGRLIKSVPAAAPPNVTVAAGAIVRVQVFLLPDGTPEAPAYVSGPWELADAAIAAARDWRVEPPKVNGGPLLTTSTLGITFRPIR